RQPRSLPWPRRRTAKWSARSRRRRASPRPGSRSATSRCWARPSGRRSSKSCSRNGWPTRPEKPPSTWPSWARPDEAAGQPGRGFDMTMTIADTAQQQSAPRADLLARHPLVFYFLLAFAFTWGYWWLIWAPLQLSAPLFQLGAFGPTAAAFLMLAITSGKPGVL